MSEEHYDCLVCGKKYNAWQLETICGSCAVKTVKNEWISVKEALPEKNEWILAFNKKDMRVCWFDVSNTDYVFMIGMDSETQFRNVTHWMPLPKPPVHE